MNRREDRLWVWGCALPLVLLLMAFMYVCGALIGSTIFDDSSSAKLLGLAMAGGTGYLVYTDYKRSRPHSSSASVIRTSGRNIPQWVKIAVAHRDEGKCRVCGSAYDLQYDHIVPYSLGGTSDDVENIQLLCGRCNRLKSNRYVG